MHGIRNLSPIKWVDLPSYSSKAKSYLIQFPVNSITVWIIKCSKLPHSCDCMCSLWHTGTAFTHQSFSKLKLYYLLKHMKRLHKFSHWDKAHFKQPAKLAILYKKEVQMQNGISYWSVSVPEQLVVTLHNRSVTLNTDIFLSKTSKNTNVSISLHKFPQLFNLSSNIFVSTQTWFEEWYKRAHPSPSDFHPLLMFWKPCQHNKLSSWRQFWEISA